MDSRYSYAGTGTGAVQSGAAGRGSVSENGSSSKKRTISITPAPSTSTSTSTPSTTPSTTTVTHDNASSRTDDHIRLSEISFEARKLSASFKRYMRNAAFAQQLFSEVLPPPCDYTEEDARILASEREKIASDLLPRAENAIAGMCKQESAHVEAFRRRSKLFERLMERLDDVKTVEELDEIEKDASPFVLGKRGRRESGQHQSDGVDDKRAKKMSKVSEDPTEISDQSPTESGKVPEEDDEGGDEGGDEVVEESGTFVEKEMEARLERERLHSRKEFARRVKEISQTFESTQVLHQNR